MLFQLFYCAAPQELKQRGLQDSRVLNKIDFTTMVIHPGLANLSGESLVSSSGVMIAVEDRERMQAIYKTGCFW